MPGRHAEPGPDQHGAVAQGHGQVYVKDDGTQALTSMTVFSCYSLQLVAGYVNLNSMALMWALPATQKSNHRWTLINTDTEFLIPHVLYIRVNPWLNSDVSCFYSDFVG